MENTTIEYKDALASVEQEDRNMVLAVWGLYIACILIPLTGLVGVIMAYVARGRAGESARIVYSKQIRLFWWGVLATVLSVLTAWLLGIGLVIYIAWFVYWLYASISGVVVMYRNKGAQP